MSKKDQGPQLRRGATIRVLRGPFNNQSGEVMTVTIPDYGPIEVLVRFEGNTDGDVVMQHNIRVTKPPPPGYGNVTGIKRIHNDPPANLPHHKRFKAKKQAREAEQQEERQEQASSSKMKSKGSKIPEPATGHNMGKRSSGRRLRNHRR